MATSAVRCLLTVHVETLCVCHKYDTLTPKGCDHDCLFIAQLFVAAVDIGCASEPATPPGIIAKIFQSARTEVFSVAVAETGSLIPYTVNNKPLLNPDG